MFAMEMVGNSEEVGEWTEGNELNLPIGFIDSCLLLVREKHKRGHKSIDHMLQYIKKLSLY